MSGTRQEPQRHQRLSADVPVGPTHTGPHGFGWTVDTPIHDIIGQAVGAASVCWTHPEHAGVFNDEHATAIVEAVLAALRAKLWPDT